MPVKYLSMAESFASTCKHIIRMYPLQHSPTHFWRTPLQQRSQTSSTWSTMLTTDTHSLPTHTLPAPHSSEWLPGPLTLWLRHRWNMTGRNEAGVPLKWRETTDPRKDPRWTEVTEASQTEKSFTFYSDFILKTSQGNTLPTKCKVFEPSMTLWCLELCKERTHLSFEMNFV